MCCISSPKYSGRDNMPVHNCVNEYSFSYHGWCAWPSLSNWHHYKILHSHEIYIILVTDLYRVEWHFVHVTWASLLHYKYNTGGFSSSGMRHCVSGWVFSDDLKHHGIISYHIVSSSRVKLFFGAVLLALLYRSRCRCHSPWNVRIHSPSDAASHPGRLESSTTPLWKSQISQL